CRDRGNGDSCAPHRRPLTLCRGVPRRACGSGLTAGKAPARLRTSAGCEVFVIAPATEGRASFRAGVQHRGVTVMSGKRPPAGGPYINLARRVLDGSRRTRPVASPLLVTAR